MNIVKMKGLPGGGSFCVRIKRGDLYVEECRKTLIADADESGYFQEDRPHIIFTRLRIRHIIGIK